MTPGRQTGTVLGANAFCKTGFMDQVGRITGPTSEGDLPGILTQGTGQAPEAGAAVVAVIAVALAAATLTALSPAAAAVTVTLKKAPE